MAVLPHLTYHELVVLETAVKERIDRLQFMIDNPVAGDSPEVYEAAASHLRTSWSLHTAVAEAKHSVEPREGDEDDDDVLA